MTTPKLHRDCGDKPTARGPEAAPVLPRDVVLSVGPGAPAAALASEDASGNDLMEGHCLAWEENVERVTAWGPELTAWLAGRFPGKDIYASVNPGYGEPGPLTAPLDAQMWLSFGPADFKHFPGNLKHGQVVQEQADVVDINYYVFPDENYDALKARMDEDIRAAIQVLGGPGDLSPMQPEVDQQISRLFSTVSCRERWGQLGQLEAKIQGMQLSLAREGVKEILTHLGKIEGLEGLVGARFVSDLSEEDDGPVIQTISVELGFLDDASGPVLWSDWNQLLWEPGEKAMVEAEYYDLYAMGMVLSEDAAGADVEVMLR